MGLNLFVAVQDEVLKKEKKETGKRKTPSGVASTPKGSPVEVTSSRVEMPLIPIDSIVSAESMVDPAIQMFANTSVDPIRHVCLAADKQVNFLIHIMHSQTNFKTICFKYIMSLLIIH